ncbi:LysR family transcriptional regulator [Noviherbaspirillum galbum]|uniref:LysR family transcriptional regulator n=1 Tax=Noviherbaspirillum galbum TaxID=2709383 RepID=A0A6B3STH3_9BURK|nr:LysR substrate-binding domain-containing protein [Noviherbaspirillum galbum]NEX63964.1 LysR family transcriptional regulator [Noviherbaspirillum galbum]
MFEISQIRCFVAVAEELHFSRAAERLNMTQPPLSRQIRLLEHHVGAQLLDRTSRSVRLTAAGKSFFPEAARILRMAEEAASTARRVAKGEQGSLSIGFTAAFGYGLLPDVVRRLRERVPGISLTLKELVTTAQLEALDSGKLDLGLMRPHPEHGEIETITLAHEALMLAIPEREAARWPQKPGLDCLHQKPFLMYSPYEARYFYQLLQSVLDRAGVQPDVVEYVGQIHTMLALVNSGIGAALIPAAAARLQFSGIVLRPMTTDPAEPVEMVCSYRRDNDNPILDIFRKQVLDGFRAG